MSLDIFYKSLITVSQNCRAGHDVMDYRELGGLAARIIQTAATNTFFGAAFYVNMVETPARKSLKTAGAMVDHFQATFPRAKQQQGSLAAIATFSGLTGKGWQEICWL